MEKNYENSSSAAVKREHTALIIEQIKKHLETSVADDSSLWEISRRVGISRYHMTHLFKKYTGMTLIEYKRKFRMEMACRLLSDGEHTISDVALECGYASTTYFSSSFQKHTGMSPSEYRRKYRK